MSTTVKNSVIQLIRRQIQHEKDLRISWFGGEPLLEKKLIKEIMTDALQHSRHSDIRIHSDMTTNAYLLDSNTFSEMLQLGVTQFQITLDGDATEHDKTRILANGRGTFDTIWQNIINTKSVTGGFELLLRIHFHEGNLSSIDKLKTQLLNEFSGDSRYKFIFKAVKKLGGKNDDQLKVISNEDRRAIIRNLNDLPSENTFASIDSHKVCYASTPNSYGIRANADIIKCTVALNKDNNRVGQLKADGSLDLNNAKMLEWTTGFFTNEPEYQKCPLQYQKRLKKQQDNIALLNIG